MLKTHNKSKHADLVKLSLFCPKKVAIFSKPVFEALSALESMDKEFEILETHEGRVRITTFSMWKSWKVSLLLMFRYGFIRWGIYIPPLTDEAIHPNYVRGRLKIHAGWDNWYGYDWLAGNEDTNAFLKGFYKKHCEGK